jgi:hypothetical protein
MKAEKNGSDRSLKPITKEQIAALAHELWLGRRCPAGRDLDIWLEAERLLEGDLAGYHRDPIPADPDRPEPDEDPALGGAVEQELEEMIRPRSRRSPTSL